MYYLFLFKEFEVFLSVLQTILSSESDLGLDDISMQYESSSDNHGTSSLLSNLSDDINKEQIQSKVGF